MNAKSNELYNRVRAQEALAVFDTQFAVAFGLEQGIFLSRLIYFCRPESKIGEEIEGERWYYSTYSNWINFSFPWMIERTLRRMVNDLEEQGLIISFQAPSVNRQKYYRPNLDAIYDKLMEEFSDVYDKVDRPTGQIGHIGTGQNGHMLINSESLTVNTSSNEDVELTKVKTRKPNPMFDAVAEVCHMDPALVGSRIAKASNALAKAGYTPQQVLAFTSYWEKNAFQYRQDKRPPTPEQVISNIKIAIERGHASSVSYEEDQLSYTERLERRQKDDKAKIVQRLHGSTKLGEN